MSACHRLWTHSPIKKLLTKIGESYQTYINYYKTHAIATCYGGIGDTSGSNSENHNKDDNDSQTDINDLENIEPMHGAGFRDFNSQNRTIAPNH